MRSVRNKIAFSVLLLSFTMSIPPALAEGVEAELERISNQALLKEIDLERAYLRWRLVGTAEPKWRRGRYFALQQAATASSMTASLFAAVEVGKNLQTPERVKQRPLRAGFAWGVVGGVLGAGSSAIEIASNANVWWQNRRHRQDPESQRKTVFGKIKEIDALLARRHELISQLHPASDTYRAACSETKVLKLFRDWCIFEYSDVYADIKSYQASNNFYYVMDVAAQTLAAVAYGMSTASLKRPTISGSISTIGIVSDAIFMIDGPLSSFGYNVMYKHWQKKLGKQLRQELADPESGAKEAMEALASSVVTDSSKKRLSVYKLWTGRYDEYLEENEERLRHLNKVAQQNNISGPLISSNYLAGDIMGSVAYYKCGKNPKAANALAFAGATASMAASAAFMALSTQYLIQEKLFERKLRKKGEMPEQLIATRLSTLDKLETMLTSTASTDTTPRMGD